MALGNTKVILEKSAYIQEGETEISERAFNLIIGGMLLWGFLLNYLTVTLFAEQAIHLVMGMNPILFIAIYFALVIAGNVMVTQGGAGLSFIGYTLIAAPIGIVLCVAAVIPIFVSLIFFGEAELPAIIATCLMLVLISDRFAKLMGEDGLL